MLMHLYSRYIYLKKKKETEEHGQNQQNPELKVWTHDWAKHSWEGYISTKSLTMKKKTFNVIHSLFQKVFMCSGNIKFSSL